MGKVNVEAKKNYSEKIRVYKGKIEKIHRIERNILAEIQKDPKSRASAYVVLSEEHLNLAANYLLLNRISVSQLGIKNDSFLNDARKCCYESIIYLEKIVTDQIDIPFSDLDEAWRSLAGLSDPKRYQLMNKLGFTIDSVMEGFGENTKWKWSFVDLNGRYAVVLKNIINFRTIIPGLDPRIQDYQIRYKLLAMVKQLLNKSANDFRLKYELSSKRIDDFRTAIRFLTVLFRVYNLLGENDLAEGVKKKIITWKQKMEDDAKKEKTNSAQHQGSSVQRGSVKRRKS
ncbi:MAG: hypothetical protein ACR2PY_04405 [Salinispira sp.]